MPRKKTYSVHREPEYEMLSSPEVMIYLFEKKPELIEMDLDTIGGVIKPGDKINGLFGPGTSALYKHFHPIEPGYLKYVGIHHTLFRSIVCGRCPGMPEKERGKYLFYGWNVFDPFVKIQEFNTYPSNSCRVVQLQYIYLNEDLPPKECLEDKYYWKKRSSK